MRYSLTFKFVDKRIMRYSLTFKFVDKQIMSYSLTFNIVILIFLLAIVLSVLLRYTVSD